MLGSLARWLPMRDLFKPIINTGTVNKKYSMYDTNLLYTFNKVAKTVAPEPDLALWV